MKWTSCMLGALTAVAVGACGGERRDSGSGTGGTGTETGTMQGGATTDTAVPSAGVTDTAGATGMSSDTAHGGARMHSDSSPTSGAAGTTGSDRGNQTKSGVTDAKTGKSTLGPGATQTRPDQGAPVTSKGDTVRAGGDTTGANQ
jgi:hypothetical protein